MQKLREMRRRIDEAKQQLESAMRDSDFSRAAELQHSQLPELQRQLDAWDEPLTEPV